MARIMVVDDEAFIRLYLEEVLGEEGHEVIAAEDGAEALSLLRRGDRPDVILLDLMMPGMNGWEFRREQASDPVLSGIPVVLISGAGDVEAEARRLGVRSFVTKPFFPQHLMTVIAGVARQLP